MAACGGDFFRCLFVCLFFSGGTHFNANISLRRGQFENDIQYLHNSYTLPSSITH